MCSFLLWKMTSVRLFDFLRYISGDALCGNPAVSLYGSGLGAGSGAAVMAYKLFGHVQVRVTAWKDPWGHYNDAGYQIAQSLFAIGTGGWFGMGLFKGKPDTIPVVVSDFVFSAISEEMGALFAICLILCIF